jgi:Na+-driven multidrug efflux pump
LSTGFSLFVALLLNIFPTAFLSLFGQTDSFIQEAIPVVRVVSLAMIMMSFSTVFLNAVIGSGNSRITLLIEANTILFYCLYVYLVMDRFHLSITIGWMSEWLYWSLMFIPSFLYLRSGKWKKTVV